MGSSASLDRPELAVEPGQQVAAQLRVRNNGSVVDQFTFESLGDGAAWIDVEPPNLSLFPGAEGTVTVQFRPPRSSNVAPGPTPFGIKVVSAEDASGSAVEEGVVTVGRFADRTVELYPLTARGRRRGRFEIAVDNRGNAPIDIELTGSDPEGSCAFQFASQAVRVEPGTAQFTKFAVVPQRTFWRGPPKTHQFQVVVTERAHTELPAPVMAGALPSPPPVAPPVPPPAGPPPQTVNGSLMQEALLPPWLIKAVLAAIAILLVLWILWMTLFKPTVESVARDAVEAPLSSLAEQVDALTPPDTPGGEVPPSGGDDGGGGGGGGGATTTTTIDAGGGGGGGATTTTDPGGGATTTTVAPPTEFLTPFGNPADFQLGTGAIVGAGTSQSFGNEFSNSFAVTDMVLQNPTGDIGTVQILRDGHLLLSSALENFRDLDLHFVAPYMFQPGQSLIMTITCTTPGPGSAGCTTSASFGGFGR